MSSLIPSAGLCASELTATTASVSLSTTLLGRASDYWQLTKPRIAMMVLVTVAFGYFLGSQGPVDRLRLGEALLGIGLLAAASSVLNQWQERATDRRMVRTAERPIAAGRVSAAESLVLGCVLAVAGSSWLVMRVNERTAGLTVLTLLLYVGVYTPLKRYTSLCTTFGAVPGALPPVLGWAAAGTPLDLGALGLFGILFLWQFPHFFAIAWIHRHDYRLAGLKMLPCPQDGRVVGWLSVVYAVALIPVSLLPRWSGLAGDGYTWAALLLGLGYLLTSIAFAIDPSRGTARRLLWSSLLYLPFLLFILSIDHWRLMQ